MKALQSLLSSPVANSIFKNGYAIAKKQPSLAPVALGGSTIAGVVMMLIGGYKIADCIRYQTASGQCDEVVENNASAVISGPLILLTGWGGFNTYNRKLREDEVPVILPPRELVEPESIPFSAPVQDFPPTPGQIVAERETGKTQQEIADLLGVSRYYVREALKEARDKPARGQKESKNKDRGR